MGNIAYKEYKKCKETVEESLMILDEESDEEMRELAKEELNAAKERIEELETELKILLLPVMVKCLKINISINHKNRR